MMGTKLEYEPCMNPNRVSVSPGQTFYTLEVVPKGCNVDANSGLVADPRYQKTGFETNEYELQDDSGAWDTMEYMRQFNRGFEKD